MASLRQPGLRLKNYQANQQQLWMFAVDPAKILAGQDGSYTAFFLPFQDPTTSEPHRAVDAEDRGGAAAPASPSAAAASASASSSNRAVGEAPAGGGSRGRRSRLTA